MITTPKIHTTTQSSKITLLSKYLWFCHLYPNKTIYHYSASKVFYDGRCGYSRSTINRLVKQFIEEGWMYFEYNKRGKKHLKFSPNWSLSGKYNNRGRHAKLKIFGKSPKEIQHELEEFIIKDELKKQKYNSLVRSGAMCDKTRKGLNPKWFGQSFREKTSKELHLSLQNIAKLFKKSVHYAYRIIERLIRFNKLLVTKHKINLVRRMNPNEWGAYKPFKRKGEFYCFEKRILFNQLPNSYDLIKEDLIDFKLLKRRYKNQMSEPITL